ncbi:MAG: RHS repeat protein [Theionarchaea archaeon]|nr:RHS repeat protein [Theionarchaea archaeon]
MSRILVSIMVAILWMGLVFNAESLAGLSDTSEEQIIVNQSFDKLRHYALQDAVPVSEEHYGHTAKPEHQPLEIHTSDNPLFDHMAVSPYYKVYFKGTTVRMAVKDAWINLELGKQKLGEVLNAESVIDQNSLSVSNVFESVDLSYELKSSLLAEIVILKEWKQIDRVIQRISWGGLTPAFQEDGSILFLDENEKGILEILPPFMRDAEDQVSIDVHYELIETETGYELHKVIDESGLEWLKKAVYPVVIDPSMQTLEDAWESSGLTPYGQYFKNLKEYVNPATGYLTVTQTDLGIPGRGLDIVLSRVYMTPAVFYGSNPYDYEAPPVDVGKGWQLHLPYIGDEYVHLWGGTIYKIEWVSNTFENHVGYHFTLVKNGDSTYTLTAASGTVYEFNTSGELTQIKDVDLNTITFNYTSGTLTSITDTIGRTVSLSYSSNRLWKITYNSAEIEFSYDANGCLVWMEDFLDRRTSYYYNTGYNNWLLSKIEYPTTGYTTYAYNRFQESNYYRYYVTNQRVYETNQVRHAAYSYTGSFEAITSCTMTMKNESDVTKGSYYFAVNDDGLITEEVAKNASGTPLRKNTYTYNSNKETTEMSVYNDGSTLSYTTYYAYDNWGNTIYVKNPEGHEKFFSYTNTSTSGFFVDNAGTVIKTYTNAFSNSTIPSAVHTALLGVAEKQDGTYVNEMYITYGSEAHPTQIKNSFGNATTWLTFSGTFNEKTGDTSFPVDLTGHTVAGNGVLQITGSASDDTYQESHYTNCPSQGCVVCSWLSSGSGWSGKYFTVHWSCFVHGEYDEGYQSIGPFTHYPGTLGYQSYTKNPGFGQSSTSFTVTTNWKAYPVQVKYNFDNSDWITITSNLKNTTANISVPITDGSHTLYFSESSSQKTKFSWSLYVPVDNTPDSYSASMTYDTYGNVTSVTDSESNTATFTYSSTYSYAYLTEISYTVGQDTITTKATYDSNRGWMTSLQEPKGVAGSGYDYLYTYDLLGRITKKEFPLLPGQSQRSYVEAIYDDTNRKTTIIDQLRHYITRHYDKLGRLTDIKWYTGQYGSGTLYATMPITYEYNDMVKTVKDPGNDQFTYAYDFLGRYTQILYPDSTSISYLYDDTNNKVTYTNGRSYDRIYWYDWLSRLTKVEEEYQPDSYAVTTYQYDEIGHLTSFTDAESHTTSYTYASLFGSTRITYPDSEYEEFEYDNIGNVTSFTDCNGNEVVYTYDDIYRVTQVQYEDQSKITFVYDLNSNRTKMEDDAPSTGDYTEYSYDYWNRLITKTRHISQDTYTISYQYDVANRLTKLTYPDSMQILYSYDDLNRMTEIKRYVDGSNDEILMDNVQYDTESLLTQLDYGNDLRATFTYDARGRVSTIDVKDGETSYLDLDFTYDSNSNITQLINGWRDTSSTWHSDTESYYYDGLDRLTSASCTSWSHTYSYDKVGNRTAIDSVTYTVNTVNEVTALSDGTSFTYDSNGNRTQKTKGSDTWVYTYDYANRLTEVEKNSETLGEYIYNGDGKRIQVTESSETTTYIYSGSKVLYEENTNGTASYIYGPVGRLAKRTTVQSESHLFYYHTDHLGSTRLTTDESKNVVTDATYHPFGETSLNGEEESSLYNGKQKDSTGLYYYGARYYDPETGRFITRDIAPARIAIPQTLNRYTYCLNNPLKYRDPDGREQAGALVGNSDYPGQKLSAQDDWIYVTWSWNPSFIGTWQETGNPACLIAMFLLCGIALAPFAAAAGVAEGIASFGAKAVSLAYSVLQKAYIALKAIRTAGILADLKIEGTLKLQTLRNILDLLEHLEGFLDQVAAFEISVGMTDSLDLVLMVTFLNAKGEKICGSVAFSNGDRYSWKLVDGVYYVLIDGEWVPVDDPDWKPGDELPSECEC